MRRIHLVLAAASFCLSAVALAQVRRDGVFMQDGSPIANLHPLIYSDSNANDRYQLWARWPRPQGCGPLRLVLGGTPIDSLSHGHDADHCSSSLELTQAQATQAASVLGVTRQDRSAIAEQVRARFRTAQTYAAGEVIFVSIAIENPSDAPDVARHRGGRNRGPRDNQWDFRIRRDGRPVRRIEAPDFGGLSTYEPHAPGTTARLRAPLASWGDVSQPGSYVVHCSYETSFVPAGIDPYTDAHRGAVWDRRFEGVVRFTVQ
jgi:hypothetical protein